MSDTTPAKPTVLHVEHRLVDLLMMQIVFRRLPRLELCAVQSGAQAVQRAASLRPSVLLIGLDLPDGHGGDWLRALRQVQGCSGIPAIALTPDGASDAMAQGFDEVWTKPLDLRRVVSRLDALIAPTVGDDSAADARRAHEPDRGDAVWQTTEAGTRAYDLPTSHAATAAGRQAFQAASKEHHT
jgi:CheY-like chemotaxis protein